MNFSPPRIKNSVTFVPFRISLAKTRNSGKKLHIKVENSKRRKNGKILRDGKTDSGWKKTELFGRTSLVGGGKRGENGVKQQNADGRFN
jgi:hypothetical protein